MSDVSSAYRDYRIPRERMAREQLAARGVTDKAVLGAMGEVPRHLFVPKGMESMAYDDRPLPIGHGQTISQPYIVALMCQLLDAKPGMSVLEVGTGSGYQAAVLQAMGLVVFTVERLRPLYMQAKELFARLDRLPRPLPLGKEKALPSPLPLEEEPLPPPRKAVRFSLSDGTMGWPDMAPFDRIIVAAGGPDIPDALVAQMADPGVLVIPVGAERRTQTLVQMRRQGDKLIKRGYGGVSFVDLVGRAGWAEQGEDIPALRKNLD